MFEDLASLLVHWPFVIVALICAVLVQILKGTIYTKVNIIKYKKSTPWFGEFLWWMRKTLPLHPVLYCAWLGLIDGMPASPGVETVAAKCLYFAAAGICSTWMFGLLKQLLKKRGIELDFTVDSK